MILIDSHKPILFYLGSKEKYVKKLFALTNSQKKRREQFSTRICKNRIFAAFEYCLHNQLKFYNSTEL